MFVAIHSGDKSRVTSIAAQWEERADALRELTNSGELICPGCEQLLWLRTGRKRRRHFAHRQLADCPMAHQSAEVLEVKAQLFQWLETKYPGRVNLDLPTGVPNWNQNVDLVVEPEPGRKFLYWVFDRQQRDRENLCWYGSANDIHRHFIHTHSTLKLHSGHEIALTASQRDFIGCSDFDAAVAFPGHGHLHFLDGEDSTVRIYRGLRCVHQPNLYAWEVQREGLLGTAKISPKTGEIVFPDDVEAREEWRRKEARDKSISAAAHRNAQPADEGDPILRPPGEDVFAGTAADCHKPSAPSLNLNGPFRCEDCGIETTEWSVATASAGTCVCRSCLNKRYGRDSAGQPI